MQNNGTGISRLVIDGITGYHSLVRGTVKAGTHTTTRSNLPFLLCLHMDTGNLTSPGLTVQYDLFSAQGGKISYFCFCILVYAFNYGFSLFYFTKPTLSIHFFQMEFILLKQGTVTWLFTLFIQELLSKGKLLIKSYFANFHYVNSK